jgi:4-hydroxy-tetrahydrodipicolinate synthase
LLVGKDFSQLSGDDATSLGFLAQGGHGAISVTANVAPRLCSEMQVLWQRGDSVEAQRVSFRLTALHQALFLESSPAPVKYAASLLGISTGEVRLPLCAITDCTKARVREAMDLAGIIRFRSDGAFAKA